MRGALRSQAAVFVTVLILAASTLGTGLFLLVLRSSSERETAARGLALVQSLARAAAEGVAEEDLDLLRKAADVVTAADVVLAAVYSSAWGPLDAVPFEKLREPADPAAIEHFQRSEAPLRLRLGSRQEFYAPVLFSAPGVVPVTIGYARIALSGEAREAEIRRIILLVTLASLVFTGAVAALAVHLADRLVVGPVLALHRDVERYGGEGQIPEPAGGPAAREVAELREGFRAMIRAVAEREERIALLLDSMGEGMYGVGLRGECTFVNAAFLRLLGFGSAGEVVGRPVHALIHHSHPDGRPYPEEECTISRAYREGRGFHSDEEVFWRTDGSVFPVEFRSHPTWRDGRVVGAVVTFSGVAARKELERQLRHGAEVLAQRNEELKALDRMKDALIRDVTHELKTPVAKQAMQIEMLRRFLGGECLATVAETLRAMERSVRRQQQVVRNLLDLSRLESGGRKYAIAPLRLDEVAREVLEDYRFQAETAGAKIEQDLAPVEVAGDREMLWHALSNLVSNALKFVPEGRPGRLRVTVAAEPGRGVFRIEDNGVGLAPEELERAFERFFQGSASVEGAGVGLPIVRTIVEALGGAVTIESPGRDAGATATVTLPLAGRDGGGVPPA